MGPTDTQTHLSETFVHLWSSLLHGCLLNEGTRQLCVLSAHLVSCLLYQRLQVLSLTLHSVVFEYNV